MAQPGTTNGIKIGAVLFDMDGLLLDTEGAYTIAQQRVLDRFGKQFTWEHKAKMMGRAAMDAAQGLLDDLQLPPDVLSPQEFLKERDALLEAVFPDTPLMPGAERLVRHLAACGVPIAVATGSNRTGFERKTSKLHADLFGLFREVVTGDQVKQAKPDPAIFLLAAERLGAAAPADRGSILVFEDAPNGVEAAHAAGMRCVMVPYPGMPEQIVEDAGKLATRVHKSLADFVPEDWGLPPYPKAA